RGFVLGHPRRRRQLWGRHLLRVPASSRRPGAGRRPVVSVGGGAAGPSLLRGLRQGGPGRAVHGRLARADPGRGAHGVGRGLLLRSDRRGRTAATPAAEVPGAGGRPDPADALWVPPSARAEGFPFGRRHYWKSGWLREVTDGAIETMLRFLPQMPSSASSVGLQQLHGVASRVAPSATAFPHRAE